MEKPRTRTPSRDIHAALIEAAEAVLIREGADGVTIRAVAAEAGVAPMGVYNRFGNKDGLIDALLIRGFSGLRDAVDTPGVADAAERLRQSGRNYRRFGLENPQHYALMFEGVIPVAEFSEELTQVSAAAFGGLVAHVDYAMAAGAIAQDEPHRVAQVVWSAVHGAVSLEIHGHCPVMIDPDQAYETLIHVLVAGLAEGSPTAPS